MQGDCLFVKICLLVWLEIFCLDDPNSLPIEVKLQEILETCLNLQKKEDEMEIESQSKYQWQFFKAKILINTYNQHYFNQRKHFWKGDKNNFLQIKILDLMKILVTRNIQRTWSSLNWNSLGCLLAFLLNLESQHFFIENHSRKQILISYFCHMSHWFKTWGDFEELPCWNIRKKKSMKISFFSFKVYTNILCFLSFFLFLTEV